jgi:hypothetical protein
LLTHSTGAILATTERTRWWTLIYSFSHTVCPREVSFVHCEIC